MCREISLALLIDLDKASLIDSFNVLLAANGHMVQHVGAEFRGSVNDCGKYINSVQTIDQQINKPSFQTG
jgi:hypothetical protein